MITATSGAATWEVSGKREAYQKPGTGDRGSGTRRRPAPISARYTGAMFTRRRFDVAALAILACLSGADARAQAPAAHLTVPFQEFTLPNGLHVILHRDTSVPVVAVNVWYHVGSGNEKLGRTGFAHLFEHLMFEGSKHVPEGAFDTWLEGAGANNNGSTNTDRTNYYIDVPVERAGADALPGIGSHGLPARHDDARRASTASATWSRTSAARATRTVPTGWPSSSSTRCCIRRAIPTAGRPSARWRISPRPATRTCRSSSAPTTRRTTPAW